MIRLLPLFAFVLAACQEHAGGDGHDHDDGHHHDPKHGGALTELGAHEGFLETKHDAEAGTLTIWIYLGEAMRDARPAAPPILNLKTGAGPKSLTAKLVDGAWVFRDEALKGEPEGGRFRFSVGGKTYTPDLG